MPGCQESKHRIGKKYRGELLEICPLEFPHASAFFFYVVFSAHIIVMLHPLQQPNSFISPQIFSTMIFCVCRTVSLQELQKVPFSAFFLISSQPSCSFVSVSCLLNHDVLAFSESFTISQSFSTILLFCLCLKVSLEDRSE